MIKNLRVYIGRFQPFHAGHMHVVKQMIHDCEEGDEILIVSGSANNTITFKNPFTTAERHEMISSVIRNYMIKEQLSYVPTVYFRGIEDVMYTHNDDVVWRDNLLKIINDLFPEKNKIILYGAKKQNDSSTYYLDLFSEYMDIKLIEPYTILSSDNITNIEISSTYIRQTCYVGEYPWLSLALNKYAILPDEIYKYLSSWRTTPSFKLLKEEYFCFLKEKTMMQKISAIYPYSIKTIAADMIVIKDNKILLIERKDFPGKGLLALPGGHVNDGETFEQAAIRELKEETNLDLVSIDNNIIGGLLADNPSRSLRPLRVVSKTFLIDLSDTDIDIHSIKAGDDAARYQWIDLKVINDYRHKLFEDHYYIIDWYKRTFFHEGRN